MPLLGSIISFVIDISVKEADFDVLDNLLKRVSKFKFLTKIIIIIPRFFLENPENYEKLRRFVMISDLVRLIAKKRDLGVNICKSFSDRTKHVTFRKDIKREIIRDFLIDSIPLELKIN